MFRWLDGLSRRLARRRCEPGEPRFECLMARADQLVAINNLAGLHDLVKIVLRPIQARHICEAYLAPNHGAPAELWWSEALNLDGYVSSLNGAANAYIQAHCAVPVCEAHELDLSTDVLLPTTWHPSSLVNLLGRIGSGRPCGAFKQSTNHRVTYMHPLGIGWVSGGNHSITQAIIRGEGRLLPTEYLDVSPVIREVSFDGRFWRCRTSGARLGSPRYEEFGWAWELGRRILLLEQKSQVS